MNIYYTHCSVLIIIAESKLKMSRSYCSYDEDWQRRKSILIRSLFHDLPILSPVTEESDDSFPPVRAYETLGEPPRPYSPLPPLIIERVPKTNKHDEPEEHYKKLGVDDNTNSNDETVGQSSHSNISNGYRADSESVETVIVDILNYTKSTSKEASKDESVSINSMEEIDTNPDNIEGGRRSDKVGSSSNEETKSEESISLEEPRLLLTANQETNTNSTVCAARMFERIIADIEEIDDSDDKSIINQDTKNTANNTTIERNEKNRHQLEIIEILSEEEIEDNGNRSIEKPGSSDKTTNNKEASYQKWSGLKDSEEENNQELSTSALEDIENAQDLEAEEEERMDMGSTKMMVENGLEVITTAALVHVDASQDIPDKESQVYEDSPKSIILPVSRMKRTATQAMLDRREELFGTERNSDDLCEVLARILNESQNNVENTNLFRKRKNFDNVSVQTNENVTWDDIRRDLFVGAPKILRLCSCVD
ncbi:hypothetical protein HW555_006047, partial [Spodoptera exigua]